MNSYRYKVGETVIYDMSSKDQERLRRAVIMGCGTRTNGNPFYSIRPIDDDGKPMRPRNVAYYSLRPTPDASAGQVNE